VSKNVERKGRKNARRGHWMGEEGHGWSAGRGYGWGRALEGGSTYGIVGIAQKVARLDVPVHDTLAV
jgi:hypothetical protein